ncbi:hypothetical protein [Methylophilus aquaticus]|uniref:Pilus assembly protein PilO n=1 Tax=Methylophilus aquaticus TaxID=1971610 RepID=A0ABT9JUJ8_9PROT|nr:hypothetical protein [Methylophilus aquaticus]MDP8568191.1 hypothetical protein [Methylophilus aquaticus]
MNPLQTALGSQWIWWVRRVSHVVGWVPLVALMLCLIVGFNLAQQTAAYRLQAFHLQQQRQQLTRQLEQKDAIAAPPQTGEPEAADLPVSEEAQMALLLAQMPAVNELSARMLQIAALAHKHHIPLNVGDYQWQPATTYKASHIQQFDMRFMIQTDYLTCRRFVADILQRYPSMALSGLELRKNDTLQPTIEATLTFSVLMRDLDATR